MKNSRSIVRTVPDVVGLIINSDDQCTVTRYENVLICMFAAPLMFLSAAVNYVNRCLILHEEFMSVLPDIIVFVLFGLMFEFYLRDVKIPVRSATIGISISLSLVLFFVVGSYYDMMGDSVWIVAFVLMAVSLIRSDRLMLSFVGTSSLLCLIYMILRLRYKGIEVTSYYIFNQVFLFLVLFVVSFAVNTINTLRYSKITGQCAELMAQKEEIAATEAELREQNVRLEEYNRQILENEETLYYLAHYDMLTGLPNREKTMEELDTLIELSEAQSAAFYVVFIDLDNFKKTNDTLGHDFGDFFIQSVAENLVSAINDGDTLGRIGGDEFALIISRELDEKQVFSYVDTIRKNLSKPFLVQDREVYTTGSFGISMFPRDGDNAVALFRSADTSMYKAKELGKNNVQFFSEYMKHEIDHRVEMERHMLNGIRNNEFFLVYQPQYFIKGQELRGFEALLRWNSSEFGLVEPTEFIPLAEETRLITPLGNWVLETACKKHRILQDTYDLDTVISVNVSAIQIKHARFIESVERALAISGLEPGHLEIEITESVFIESLSETVMLLKKLKDIGVRIALDDFGTGYSSLSYLVKLPLDTLKIDKSFIDDMMLRDTSQRMIGDIISIAHHMELFTIAEGVEHHYQLEYLTSMNCDGVQGFLVNKPLSEEDLERMLKEATKTPTGNKRPSTTKRWNAGASASH